MKEEAVAGMKSEVSTIVAEVEEAGKGKKDASFFPFPLPHRSTTGHQIFSTRYA